MKKCSISIIILKKCVVGSKTNRKTAQNREMNAINKKQNKQVDKWMQKNKINKKQNRQTREGLQIGREL